MPKFLAQNLLSSPLDTPELPPGDKRDEESRRQAQDYYDSYEDYDPVRTLLEWKAPSRPHRKRDRSFYTTVAILIILIGAIAFLFLQDYLLIGALFAFGFVVYVLNFVEPSDVEYKLSTQGVTIDAHFYHWEELDSFWFNKKDNQTLLNILTHYRFPAVLILVLDHEGEEEVKRLVARYLPFHEIAPKSTFDKWTESLQKHFPLETPHH
jgi:hypothetical protein